MRSFLDHNSWSRKTQCPKYGQSLLVATQMEDMEKETAFGLFALTPADKLIFLLWDRPLPILEVISLEFQSILKTNWAIQLHGLSNYLFLGFSIGYKFSTFTHTRACRQNSHTHKIKVIKSFGNLFQKRKLLTMPRGCASVYLQERSLGHVP